MTISSRSKWLKLWILELKFKRISPRRVLHEPANLFSRLLFLIFYVFNYFDIVIKYKTNYYKFILIIYDIT